MTIEWDDHVEEDGPMRFVFTILTVFAVITVVLFVVLPVHTAAIVTLGFFAYVGAISLILWLAACARGGRPVHFYEKDDDQ